MEAASGSDEFVSRGRRWAGRGGRVEADTIIMIKIALEEAHLRRTLYACNLVTPTPYVCRRRARYLGRERGIRYSAVLSSTLETRLIAHR